MSTAEIVARMRLLERYLVEHNWGNDLEIKTARDALAALEQQNELLHVRQKMLNYIAFVLADNEQADPQLAADRAKIRLEQQEAEIVALRATVERLTAALQTIASMNDGEAEGCAAWCAGEILAGRIIDIAPGDDRWPLRRFVVRSAAEAPKEQP